MAVEIQFLGAVGTVTGSLFLVDAAPTRLLVECGMFQGSPEEVARNRIPFEFPPESVDAVLLTHAHLDHCGRLPALVRAGFRGPIYATAATAELAAIVLRDSAKLQEESAARYARRHRHHDEPFTESEATAEESDDPAAQIRRQPPVGETRTREALYSREDAERTITLFRPVAYDDDVAVADGVRARFRDAGHILGSAIIELKVAATGEPTTVVFSGDLGRTGTPIIRDPTPIPGAGVDAVVVESTYGGEEHGDQADAVEELARTLNEVVESSGVLLVPAFAIGRTQELVWVLDDLLRDGRIPRLPLFVDSPMASRASDIYARHPEAYDAETVSLTRGGESPLDYPGAEFTNAVERSKAIRNARRPFMLVASSGMLTGGRIMHHLKDLLPDPAATLLFIGYQGEGTLGRHLQDGATTARIDGRDYEVRCRVRSISGFSAHADEDELIAWLRALATPGRGGPRIFVVHGDPEAADALAARVRADLGLDVHVPTYRERVAIP